MVFKGCVFPLFWYLVEIWFWIVVSSYIMFIQNLRHSIQKHMIYMYSCNSKCSQCKYGISGLEMPWTSHLQRTLIMSLCEGTCCTALINVLGLEKFCLLHCRSRCMQDSRKVRIACKHISDDVLYSLITMLSGYP